MIVALSSNRELGTHVPCWILELLFIKGCCAPSVFPLFEWECPLQLSCACTTIVGHIISLFSSQVSRLRMVLKNKDLRSHTQRASFELEPKPWGWDWFHNGRVPLLGGLNVFCMWEGHKQLWSEDRSILKHTLKHDFKMRHSPIGK